MAINLGDINFGLGADTRRLQNARDAVIDFGRAVNSAARSQAEGARQAEAALRRQEAALIGAYNQTVKLNDAIRQSGAPAALLQTTTNTFNRLTREMANGRVTALQYQRSMEDFNTSTTRVNRSLTEHRAAVRAAEQATRAAAQASRDNARAMREAETATMRQESALFGAAQAVQRYQDAVRRAQAPTSLNAGPQAALTNFQTAMTTPGISRLDQQRATQQFTAQMQTARASLAAFTSGSHNIGTMTQLLQQLSAAAILVAGPLSGIATRLSIIASVTEHFNLATAGALAGIAGASYGFYKLGEAAIDTAKKIQNVQQTLTAVYGSKTVGDTNLKAIMELADRSGQAFAPLAKQYSQIAAAAKGTNLEGERTVKIFESIVFAGAKLGLSSQDVEGTLRAIQQIMSKGTVQAEELRGQLGDRLPGAMQIMADALGVTTVKLDTMLKKGEVGRSALVAFAEQVKIRFGIDVTKPIDTIVAAENRFGNAVTKVNDSVDKAIGFSKAYVNVLNAVASGLTSLSFNVTPLLNVLGAVAGAMVGLAGPAVLTGILAIGRAVVVLTASVWGLNTAILANPVGAFAQILMRAALAVAGAYAGFKLMENATQGTTSSLLTALPAVQSYIDAQQVLKTTVRATTEEYIKQLDALQADRLTKLVELSGQSGDDVKKEFAEINAAYLQGNTQLKQLKDILKRQTAEEEKARPDPLKDLTNSQTIAIKNAKDTVRELQQQYKLLYAAPGQQAYLKTQLDINKAVENFRDALTKSLGDSPKGKGQIAGLVDEYAKALRRVKEAELDLAQHTSYFQAIEGIYSRGLEGATGKMVDNIVEGKNAFTDFGNVAQDILKDLLKTFIQLGALNPLKNMLFGTNDKVLGGMGGVGGVLGSGLSGLFGGTSSEMPSLAGASAAFSAAGGIVGPYGRIPIKQYSGGGIARSPQISIFGEGDVAEAYVPVPSGKIPVEIRGGSSSSNVELHIHPAPGTTTTQQRSTTKSGAPRIDVYIKRLSTDGFVEDLASGGSMSQALEARYGLDRTKGMTG